jgi:hypothetical protein
MGRLLYSMRSVGKTMCEAQNIKATEADILEVRETEKA